VISRGFVAASSSRLSTDGCRDAARSERIQDALARPGLDHRPRGWARIVWNSLKKLRSRAYPGSEEDAIGKLAEKWRG